MKVLVSAISIAEAHAVVDGGADILDIKNVKEGSLGANFPWVIREITETFSNRDITFAASLGDLSAQPGTASLAALGACTAGVQYVKAGLHGVRNLAESIDVMNGVAKACKEYNSETIVVAAGYADYRTFGGIDPMTLIAAAVQSGCDLVMLDTAFKDGKTLFDALSILEIESFVSEAKKQNLQVALAGSIKFNHIDIIRQLDPDVVGVRGCVCESSDRSASIIAPLVREFTGTVRVESVT